MGFNSNFKRRKLSIMNKIEIYNEGFPKEAIPLFLEKVEKYFPEGDILCTYENEKLYITFDLGDSADQELKARVHLNTGRLLGSYLDDAARAYNKTLSPSFTKEREDIFKVFIPMNDPNYGDALEFQMFITDPQHNCPLIFKDLAEENGKYYLVCEFPEDLKESKYDYCVSAGLGVAGMLGKFMHNKMKNALIDKLKKGGLDLGGLL